MAKKGKREKIKLESSAGTGHFYTTIKNRQNTPSKIEMKKFFGTPHCIILVRDLTGRVRHRLLFGSKFLAENTLVEIIEKLTSWHLEDVLRKAGETVVLVGDEGLFVPCLGGLNL